ncbi:hypothetical protein TNCV_1504611 [Trichonephila clavipes]|uniref:Uncharacterized protein n=1 Tax=Trichonephila clavipes TaxID=2585209 RepID=A0A8X6RQW4_TRICX|nr:hypothetical protein TNCV_1504611 [Trichonephila clavipes]
METISDITARKVAAAPPSASRKQQRTGFLSSQSSKAVIRNSLSVDQMVGDIPAKVIAAGEDVSVAERDFIEPEEPAEIRLIVIGNEGKVVPDKPMGYPKRFKVLPLFKVLVWSFGEASSDGHLAEIRRPRVALGCDVSFSRQYHFENPLKE